MDSTIRLSFRYSEQDIVRAMRAHNASRLRPKTDIAVAVAAAVLGVYSWQSLDLRWFGMALIGLSTVLVLVLVVAFSLIPRLVFRRGAKFRDKYSLTFSIDGIHFRTAHINSQLECDLTPSNCTS